MPDQNRPQLRVATPADLPAIMGIVADAKRLLRHDGIPQWQKGSPNEELIAADIARGWSYLLELDGQVVASTLLQQVADPAYQVIYDGAWLPASNPGQADYATIHRSCVSAGHHGEHLGALLLSGVIEAGKRLGFRQFRIDTHALNSRMQHLILAAGFTYVGNVRMNDDPADMRRAYQLFL